MPYYGSIATGIFFIHPKREMQEVEKLVKLVEANKGSINIGGLGSLKTQFARKDYLEKISILKGKYDPYNLFTSFGTVKG